MRSERIQPGVNQEPKAPKVYQERQTMDIPDELTVMCGRAAYNAFTRWTGVDRATAKSLLLLERIDVLTANGKERLRAVRDELNRTTDQVIRTLPKWVEWPTNRLFSKNANRGRKAFALAGQRIYIGGLAEEDVRAHGLDWQLCTRSLGAAAARSGLMAELMGCVNIPEGCDMLAGVCLMAGPVNQNDIGKCFYGEKDLLAGAHPGKQSTSMLVWTLKAKTVADPIGNEEQLMNPKRKGALVDLRPGPHEVVMLRQNGQLTALREHDGQTNLERAFSDAGNFVKASNGAAIDGNEGAKWPGEWRQRAIFTSQS
jgi:hypothetical protein